MTIKELFEKVKRNKPVPEWISIKAISSFNNKPYSINGKNYHFREKDKRYYIVGEKHFLNTLDNSIINAYQQKVWEQFEILECTATEEEKIERLNGDKTLDISENIGLEIIR